ncbi:hypothetical protein [Nitratireductor sp. ZSWI3]|uniref:hypothetical protein n=1 Tax=Nitratireductor sp. ZSWI3 TaxID=2966359 RepID=UPI0021504AA4|nr:hypothetical protein [Nitratireductor sp. ZSWI3]MCR4268935.1 hypothetical protein [Nitratireductor sp. ZSWI3]
MIRFLFRVLAIFALAVAVVMAVIDATRSIAASALTFTPLGESWFSVSPGTLNLAQAVVQRHTLPVLWDPLAVFILTLPGWLVFAALSLLFYAIGRKRNRALSLA